MNTVQSFSVKKSFSLVLLLMAFIVLQCGCPAQVEVEQLNQNTKKSSFVNPIELCKKKWDGKLLNGSPVDCTSFEMGSPESEVGRDSNELQHKAHFTYEFEIAEYEVTQFEWLKVMSGTDLAFPSSHRANCGENGDENDEVTYSLKDGNEQISICQNHPVETVSYDQITGPNGFLERKNRKEAEYIYRLPTEAEWEYSARGGAYNMNGTFPPFWFGDDGDDLELFEWFFGNSPPKDGTHAVRSRASNEYGLFDMEGNVAEWTQDWYQENYPAHDDTDPQGPSHGSLRVCRGSSWYNPNPWYARTASRNYAPPGYKSSVIGFRLVRIKRNY